MSDQVYYSTGRGGAGNIKASKDAPSPELAPRTSVPPLHNDTVTTGRGGLGNMMKNDNPELTRKAQDVDQKNDVKPVTSNKSFIGRGGYGNFISSDDNLYTVTSNGPNDEDSKKKSLVLKIASFFKSK